MALYIWNDYKLETVERAHVKANAIAVTAMYSHNDAFFTGDKQGKIKIWRQIVAIIWKKLQKQI